MIDNNGMYILLVGCMLGLIGLVSFECRKLPKARPIKIAAGIICGIAGAIMILYSIYILCRPIISFLLTG
jgi:hypothetical protein